MPRILLSILILLLSGCAGEAGSRPPSGPPPVYVDVLTIELQPIDDVVRMVGAFKAKESVMIRSETEGVIDEIAFDEGQPVKQGDLLIKLRDAEERTRLAEAEAQLDLANDEFERARTLAGRQTLSKSELDRARAEREVAVARRDRNRVMLDEKRILAPFDGILGERLVSPGDRVDHERDLVQIDAIDPLRLVFTLPEMAIGLARPGIPVEVSVVPYPGETFGGEVYFVAPTVDPRNRRLVVKALVPNPERKLRPGMFANIDAKVADREAAVVVPESAIAYDAEGPFVWRVGDGEVVERVAIALGIRGTGRIEITKGLTAGDRIVSAGTHKVMPGSVVKAANGDDAAS